MASWGLGFICTWIMQHNAWHRMTVAICLDRPFRRRNASGGTTERGEGLSWTQWTLGEVTEAWGFECFSIIRGLVWGLLKPIKLPAGTKLPAANSWKKIASRNHQGHHGPWPELCRASASWFPFCPLFNFRPGELTVDLPVPWERCESRLGAACWVWILQIPASAWAGHVNTIL